MYTLNTILFSILFAVLSCVVNTSSAVAQGCQIADCSGPYDGGGSQNNANPYNNQPYSGYDSRPGYPFGGLNNQQDRNQWSSGQPHRPSDQFTPPPPVTENFSVWKDGKLQSTCSRSGNSVYCQ